MLCQKRVRRREWLPLKRERVSGGVVASSAWSQTRSLTRSAHSLRSLALLPHSPLHSLAPLPRPAPTPSSLAPHSLRRAQFWIHGGCYVEGTPNDALYNGSNIIAAARAAGLVPPVVVATAYRLNVLGFLGGAEELRARDPKRGSAGNYGIQDQRAAMEWTRDNVAAFDGDPKRVFVWGQSAGAGSVAVHLVTKPSWPLFARAGMESGSFANWIAYNWDAAANNYNRTLAAVGCADLACLLATNVTLLTKMVTNLSPPCRDGCAWAPTVDGVEMTDYPWRLLEKGHHARGKAILHGTQLDDGSDFMNEVSPLPPQATDKVG